MGYYAALNVSPEASAVEIRLSYEMLKQAYHSERKHLDIGKIRAAYQTLSHPVGRKAYDTGRAVGKASRVEVRQVLKTHSLPIALALIAVGVVVLLALVGPELRARFVAFDPGDELVWVQHHESLGTIEAFEEHHAFPTGAVAPAYLVRPTGGGEPVWYPARDLKRHARER